MKNILLADDVEGWLKYHKENLLNINKDYNIYAFKSAKEAYDFAFTFKDKFDLVITDLQMEPMEELAGKWLIDNLKTVKSTRLSKFIIISSCWNINFIAEQTGAEGFLKKVAYRNDSLMLKSLLEELFGDRL